MSMKELVVCKFDGCNQVYKDPRILPCGKRTCAAHIDEMTMKSDNSDTNTSNGSSTRRSSKVIKCHFCHKIHAYADDNRVGFVADENIALLLDMKHCREHDAAKRSFGAVTQLLDKLAELDTHGYVLDYFERLEADIVVEREANMHRLSAHYEQLLDEVHERKAKCMHAAKVKETLESEMAAIKRQLAEHATILHKERIDLTLQTLDGDEDKWRDIQFNCNLLLGKVRALDHELTKAIVGEQAIGFRPPLHASTTSSARLESMCGKLDARLIDSAIVGTYGMENELVELCKLSGKQFKLLYRATKDGFEAASFHAKCDNQANTFTVIRTTNDCVFGGYASVAWDGTSKYKEDPQAFLFSLVNGSESCKPLLMPIKAGDKYAICCNAAYGPIFGGGNDIIVWNNSNTSNESYSNLGRSFDFKLFSCATIKAQSYLAGSRNFQTSEIEVFQICSDDEHQSE